MTDERTRRIQERAHSIWEQEGQPHGRDAQHWSQAEREIDAEDDARASSPAGTTAARRHPERRAVTKAAADTLGASGGEAIRVVADVSAEEPVKTRNRKPKAVSEDGTEQPKARRGRSSKVAAEASADAPATTRGRKPKAAGQEGAEALKSARGRKAKAVSEEGSTSSTAARDPQPKTAVAEEAAGHQAQVAQYTKMSEEPTMAADASHTAE
ncbi:DUF2934 domain-containing protein [Paracoccus benzoatiresistens]|uniref:DUF2934 domain-containing protein n=1 Tax=Paracoccus benzoatiresistens TaxID=2997341 RepID=A0ABT4JCD9_9RHOB|nr:DUF2934 domain-containing protein [Paracoccus sp. EF6]MCZ0964242.1 DUF2934 domain-containing protein [Paracoccus sp. EF6]